MRYTLFALLTVLTVSACSGVKSPKIVGIKESDKGLTCEQLALDINEAVYYRTIAEKNKGSIGNMLSPLGYIKTASSANSTIEGSNVREEYLSSIYKVKSCDSPDAKVKEASSMTPDTAAAIKRQEIINSL